MPSWLDFSRGLVPIARAWHAWRGHQTRAGLMLLAISDCRPPELPRRLCCFYVSALTCRGRRRRYSAPHRRKFPATSAVGGRRRPVLSMRGTGYIQGKSASRGCQQLRAAMPGCQPRATRQARRTKGGPRGVRPRFSPARESHSGLAKTDGHLDRTSFVPRQSTAAQSDSPIRLPCPTGPPSRVPPPAPGSKFAASQAEHPPKLLVATRFAGFGLKKTFQPSTMEALGSSFPRVSRDAAQGHACRQLRFMGWGRGLQADCGSGPSYVWTI